MNHNDHLDELIDSYLLDELSEAERLVFEEKMRNEPSLKEKVEEQREFIDLIRETRHSELKERVKAIHQKMKAEAVKTASGAVSPKRRGRIIPFNPQFFFRIAAAVLILGGIGIVFFIYRPGLSEKVAIDTKNQKEEDEIVFGEPRDILLNTTIVLKKFEVQEDGNAVDAGSGAIHLQMEKQDAEGLTYQFNGDTLKIFTNQGEKYKSAELMLFELIALNGVSTFYGRWNFSNDFFEIDTTTAQQPLEKVEARQVLRILSTLNDF